MSVAARREASATGGSRPAALLLCASEDQAYSPADGRQTCAAWPAARRLADPLVNRSEEFHRLLSVREVGLCPHEVKHFAHPPLGPLTVPCQPPPLPGPVPRLHGADTDSEKPAQARRPL
ncbi:MmyB family transcriptional regulator [Nocardiopsis coralliicola]